MHAIPNRGLNHDTVFANRVAAVRIFYWTAYSIECSEHYAALPHRQCFRSQSGEVLGPVRTQRALTPIRNYGRSVCAPERSPTPARAALGRARRAVRRAYEAPLPNAITRTFGFDFRTGYGVRPRLTATMPRYTQTPPLISNSPSEAEVFHQKAQTLGFGNNGRMLAVGPPLCRIEDHEVLLWCARHRFPDQQDYENRGYHAPGDSDEGEKRCRTLAHLSFSGFSRIYGQRTRRQSQSSFCRTLLRCPLTPAERAGSASACHPPTG